MKSYIRIPLLALAAASLTLLAGCPEESKSAKSIQAEKAQAAANSIEFTENAEIDNIKRRLELTSKPGLLGYIVLLNQSGQPVFYGAVKGKVTSGSKRLTKPDRATSDGTNGMLRAAPSDEGTFGSSGEYVFFWTTNDQYIQWNGGYLYSDKPIRLSVQPLVVSVEPAAK
jgi:hypothetical protein